MTNEIYQTMAKLIEFIQNHLTDSQIDEYLEFRESFDFDSAWVNADKAIEKIKTDDKNFIESEKSLREKVFKFSLKYIGNIDLAVYLSDDAGLIYANLFFNANNEFIKDLYQKYQHNQLLD